VLWLNADGVRLTPGKSLVEDTVEALLRFMPTINLKQHRFTGRDVATETTLYIAQLSTFGLNSQNFEIFTFFPAAPMPKRFEPAFSKTTHFVPQEVP